MQKGDRYKTFIFNRNKIYCDCGRNQQKSADIFIAKMENIFLKWDSNGISQVNANLLCVILNPSVWCLVSHTFLECDISNKLPQTFSLVNKILFAQTIALHGNFRPGRIPPLPVCPYTYISTIFLREKVHRQFRTHNKAVM